MALATSSKNRTRAYLRILHEILDEIKINRHGLETIVKECERRFIPDHSSPTMKKLGYETIDGESIEIRLWDVVNIAHKTGYTKLGEDALIDGFREHLSAKGIPFKPHEKEKRYADEFLEYLAGKIRIAQGTKNHKDSLTGSMVAVGMLGLGYNYFVAQISNFFDAMNQHSSWLNGDGAYWDSPSKIKEIYGAIFALSLYHGPIDHLVDVVQRIHETISNWIKISRDSTSKDNHFVLKVSDLETNEKMPSANLGYNETLYGLIIKMYVDFTGQIKSLTDKKSPNHKEAMHTWQALNFLYDALGRMKGKDEDQRKREIRDIFKEHVGNMQNEIDKCVSYNRKPARSQIPYWHFPELRRYKLAS